MSHGGLLDLFLLLVLEAQNPTSTLSPQFLGRNKGRDPARRPFRQTGLSRVTVAVTYGGQLLVSGLSTAGLAGQEAFSSM